MASSLNLNPEDLVKYQESLKEDLVDLAKEMTQNALHYTQVLQKDNERLSLTADAQQRQIDDTRTQGAKAKELVRSKHFSFLKEVLLLLLGVVIFFLMLFFIFMTKAIAVVS